MNILVYIAMYGWIPAVLLLFAALPPRRAAVAAFVAAWLFLPVISFRFPGLPDYTKMSATTAGVLLAMLIFDAGRLAALRPRWFDLPMLAWCLAPGASSLANGLGAYDAAAAVLGVGVVPWGLPYLIGRAYFADAEGLRELALGVAIGGLIYVPLCLWEVRMSPQLHVTVYGFRASPFHMVKRLGGFRPMVFMKHGLELGMWMAATSVVAYGLWAGGAARRLGGASFGALTAALVVTAVACKSSGAILLMAVGIAALWAVGRSRSRAAACALILVAPLYLGARGAGLWSGDQAVTIAARYVGEDRAASLEFRMYNEDLLVAHALQRPALGWGGWGRSDAIDPERRGRRAIPDGLWVIALGKYGLFGLGALYASLLLPLALLTLRRPASAWRTPELAPAASLGVLLALYAIDCLMNDMPNPIYPLAMGGLTAFAGSRAWSSGAAGPAGAAADAGAGEGGAGPADGGARRRALDAENDEAWRLANDPDPRRRDPGDAARRAAELVAMDPARATYWNTLGAALYRAGDHEGAVRALERSAAVGGGGAFDAYFLAMAHRRRGDAALAREWFARGDAEAAGLAPEPEELRLLRAEALAVLRPGAEAGAPSA